MENRTAAVIITIIAVIICLCPGIAALCLGLASALDYAAGFGIFATDQNTYLSLIFGGACVGIFLIVVAAVIIFLVLRQKKASPPPP
ncbi:MAG TPA: hypothetical protein VLD65_01235, partial [Anaerolineales bacterium]|nr:hypothetical protein [Anaerolineales bacterium]